MGDLSNQQGAIGIFDSGVGGLTVAGAATAGVVALRRRGG